MTVLEQRFMERVPGLLHDLTEAIQGLTEAVMPKQEEPGCVWVFTAEQVYDLCAEDVIVKTFKTQDAARRFLHDFIHEGGDDSITEYVKEHEWVVEVDEPDHYLAYESGYYVNGHVECTITKCEILK